MLGWIFFIICYLFYAVLSTEKKNQGFAKWFFLIFLILFTGFRYRIGWDYDSYNRMFYEIKEVESIEIAWRYLIIVLNLFSNNSQLLFLTSALIIYSAIFKFTYKYSEFPVLSLFVFICSPFYFAESLSVLRQYVSIVLFLYSYKYILSRDIYKFTLANLFGLAFHFSSLLYFPLYFIVNRKIGNLVFISLLGTALFSFSIISSYLPQVDLLVKYAVYTNDAFHMDSNSGIDQLIRFVIFFLVLFSRKKLNYDKDLFIRSAINLFLIGVIICTGLYFYPPFRRISYGFMIFEMLVIPVMFKAYFKNQYPIRSIILAGYFLFSILTFGKKWWPNKTDYSGTNTIYEMRLFVDKPIPKTELN
jgi:transmembrane protein EpsG